MSRIRMFDFRTIRWYMSHIEHGDPRPVPTLAPNTSRPSTVAFGGRPARETRERLSNALREWGESRASGLGRTDRGQRRRSSL